MNDLDPLVTQATAEFADAPTPAALEDAKSRFLGKAGRVTELLKGLAKATPEEKKTRGAAINLAKQQIEAASVLDAKAWPTPNSTPSSRPRRWT